MPDLFDQEAALEQLTIDAALSHRKATMPYIGKCHWCEEPVQANAHFCDSDCRDDFEQYKRRNGGF
nr:MAG TPA: DNA-directed RNA polymerase subunit alpha [Caudoviricetes sp.]